MRVHGAVQTTRLVDVAVDAILNLLRCVSYLNQLTLDHAEKMTYG